MTSGRVSKAGRCRRLQAAGSRWQGRFFRCVENKNKNNSAASATSSGSGCDRSTLQRQERERDAVDDAVRRAGEAEGVKLRRQREAAGCCGELLAHRVLLNARQPVNFVVAWPRSRGPMCVHDRAKNKFCAKGCRQDSCPQNVLTLPSARPSLPCRPNTPPVDSGTALD